MVSFTSNGSTTAATNTWPAWNVTYSTTTAESVSGDTIISAGEAIVTWTNWVAQSITTGATTLSNTLSTINWNAWSNQFDIRLRDARVAQQLVREQQRVRQPSPEELQRRLAEEKRMRELAEKRLREEKEARERAEELLLQNLNDEQREDLVKRERFFVESIQPDGTRRRYRINRGTHGNVYRLNERGEEVERFCVQPNGVPVADAMLAQKLAIEANEAEFRAKANITTLRAAG